MVDVDVQPQMHVPPAHRLGHTVPQVPQLFLSIIRFTQFGAQQSGPIPFSQVVQSMFPMLVGHMHPPFTHTPVPHEWPHVPQLAESLFRSAQPDVQHESPPPHACCEAAQTQLPWEQTSPSPQAWPHTPQLSWSVCRSLHTVPNDPLQHTSEPAQALPVSPHTH
jgi:hypothetical protein